MNKEPWPKRWWDAFRGQPVKPLPPAEPKHLRYSGPREVPSDWWDRPEMVWPQCTGCHTRILPGMPELKEGRCGPCRQEQHESPDAA